jgi:hypothetical protein
MPMKNPERALVTLVGEFHALYIAVQVLAKTHENPNLAVSELAQAEQLGLAAIEPHPIPDATVVGYQDVIAGIRGALAANPLYSRA